MSQKDVEIKEVGVGALAAYATIPMTIEVRSVLCFGGEGGSQAQERPVAPYVKDYDAQGGPEGWPTRFDVSTWGFWLAREGGVAVGAAAVAYNTGGVHLLEGGPDVGVLWDLRVRPEARGRGVGRALREAAAGWLRERGCARMMIETQDVNVGACAFYRACGCALRRVDPMAYAEEPEVAHEVMVMWALELG